MDDSEWVKINSLLELGLFSSVKEAISFFLSEGIKARNDIFQKSLTIVGELKKLRENVKKS